MIQNQQHVQRNFSVLRGNDCRGRDFRSNTVRSHEICEYSVVGGNALRALPLRDLPHSDSAIVSYAIYPRIGIARVGNLSRVFLLTPKRLDPARYFFEDDSLAAERQFVRFRIYGLDADRRAVREITADEARITWQVHLENLKSGWGRLRNALADNDITVRDAGRDRATVVEVRRHAKPGDCTIAGRNEFGRPEYCFESGGVSGLRIRLGELRTDEYGRLIVLGSEGRPVTYHGPPSSANSDLIGDSSDGPVRATVEINGRQHAAEAAMVVVASQIGPGMARTMRHLCTSMEASPYGSESARWHIPTHITSA